MSVLARFIRRVADRLFRLADWIEGGEVVYQGQIDLEPEHGLKALRNAEEARRENRA